MVDFGGIKTKYMTSTTTSTSSSTTEFEVVEEFGESYHDAVIKFKSIWPNYRKVTRELAEPVNQMVDIIFGKHPDWSVRKTLSQIAADLGDLKGFSVRQLYRFLDDKSRSRIQKKSLTYDTTKLLETDKEESSRLEKERQENEGSAKNVRRIYGIDITTSNENPLELKGHSHCLEKQQRLREQLDAVKGQMIHYKKFFDKNVILDESKKVSTVYDKNVTAEREMDKSLNSEIEKCGGRMMIIEQLKDENTELKDRVGHLEQKMAETKIRIVTATPSYCKKIYDISQRKENAIVCLIIDGSDLFGVIDHYPTNEELENMIPPS
jgi:hypothetical protein